MKLLTLITLATALHAAPSIRDILPHGAQRGKTVTLHIRGAGLAAGAKLQTTLPAGVSRLIPSVDDPGMNSDLPFLLSIKADAPVGLYPIRVLTNDGMSNVMLFAVGDLPEVEEHETKNPKDLNNTAATAQKIDTPAVINGTLTEADEDFYAFTAKAGQRLVFEVEARRVGSAIDPSLELQDAAGKVLARNEDAPGLGVDSRIEYTFAKAGVYRIRVRDARYSDQSPNFYRLKIGSYAYAEAMFPLGWRRGESVEVELAGGNLAAPVKVKADTSGEGKYTPVNAPGSAALPMQFVIGDKPEVIESDNRDLKPSTILNGRISKPGEVDRYKLAVKPGENWVFELAAASLGTSQLDALITLYDAKGKKLVSRDDTAALDPIFPYMIPDGVSEITVAVEDVLGRGGAAYGYRLEARREPADFAVILNAPFINVPAGGTAVIPITVARRGYDGELRVRVLNLPQGFHAAGGHVPNEAASQDFRDTNNGFRASRAAITITADPDAKAEYFELTVVGEAETPQGVLRRTAITTGIQVTPRGTGQRTFSTPWMTAGLPMAVAKPLPASLAGTIPFIRIAQGFEMPIQYQLTRRGGAKQVGRVRLDVTGGVGNLRILGTLPGKTPDTGVIPFNTNYSTPAVTFDAVLIATIDVDGKPMEITSPAIEFDLVNGYLVKLENTQAKVAPGGKFEFRGKVHREWTFQGNLVRVSAQDLPDGVSCAQAEVPEPKTDFVIACEAGAGAVAGTQEIRIASSAPDTGAKAKEEYKIPDVAAKLVVAGAASAAR